MTTRALVLGGGGPVGIGWEAGMVRGLAEEGVPLQDADLIVGTSAGAIVGTLLAHGIAPDDLYDNYLERVNNASSLTFDVDPALLEQIDKLWTGGADMTAAVAAQIGELAANVDKPAEEDWIQIFRDSLDSLAWPERPLRITGVNIETGEQAVWTKDSGVQLERAIAGSCALPGWFQPVTVDGGRYMDGGLRSVSSLHLAAGYDVVVALAPSGANETGYDVKTRKLLYAEADDLRASGAIVETALQDAESLEASGPSRMDPNALMPAAEAGRRQGRLWAPDLRDLWNEA